MSATAAFYVVQSDDLDWLERPTYSAAVETALAIERSGEQNVVILGYFNDWHRSLLPDELGAPLVADEGASRDESEVSGGGCGGVQDG